MTTQTRLVEVRQQVLKHNDLLARALRRAFTMQGSTSSAWSLVLVRGRPVFLKKC